MMLSIFANRLIRDVQEDFTRAFPFLKIEFFRNGQVMRKERHGGQTIVAQNRTLREAWCHFKEESEMDVPETMSVSDLERIFAEKYGLIVHVFRRSGNLWLETSITEHWTLKQQNENGKEISQPFINR